jgi:hypothetical protein
MGRGEVSWKGQNERGIRREVYAKKSGRAWRFYAREQRFDRWMPLSDPPLEDWLELLNGVQRRIARRLMRPEEEDRLKRAIADLFPDWEGG